MTDDLVRRLRTELLEWLDKTKWVQQTCQTHELGLHRADILRNRIEALAAEIERWREALEFYAEAKNWAYVKSAGCNCIDADGGDTARAALEKQP